MSAPRAGGKDLTTTERELNAKMDEKDAISNTISALNKELSMLNESIQQANNSATRAENLVREKEKMFANEQEMITKRQELSNTVQLCQEKEDKVRYYIIIWSVCIIVKKGNHRCTFIFVNLFLNSCKNKLGRSVRKRT